MVKEKLNESWHMRSVRDRKEYSAQVPCSVMSVLIDNGVMEDPYYRDNELKSMTYFEDDYEFARMFTISGEHMREDEIDIVFYGLDTLVDIYINGDLIAAVNDMHRVYRFSIKRFVKPGANEIALLFHSPLAYIREHRGKDESRYSTTALGSLGGGEYIRKAHSMLGWDWGPQLPDAGIFRDIELQCYSKTRIIDVIVNQKHEDGNVTLTVDPILKIIDNIPLDIDISFGSQPDIQTVIRMPESGRSMTRRGENAIEIPVRNPELWWPNGMGEQKLYNLTVRVGKAGKVFDERKLKIGLRTIEVSRNEDEYGREFTFVVNGRKMFAMGANYVPEDAIYPRITEARQEELVRDAYLANFNCLRVWGGGYYQSDRFYDLCDKYGIVVWQDLMFACNAYKLEDDFEQNIIAEIKDNIKRIRHHACLGLWCGNNEIEAGYADSPSYAEYGAERRADYIKIFEYLVPKAIRQMDQDTFFWPSSPSSGGCFDNPSDENNGDSHYWEVWHGQKPISEYNNHYFRFLSEFGFQSFPSLKTVDTYTLPEDRNAFSRIMEHHQKNKGANGKMLQALAETFLYPKDFAGVVYVSQILQGLAIKEAVNHLRRNRGRCMGTLYWQFNDVWPGQSWSGVDYYGRWKALQYMARRFYAPVSASLVLNNEREKAQSREVKSKYNKPAISVWGCVSNESSESTGVRLALTLRGMDGKDIVHYDDSAHAASGKVASMTPHDFSIYIDRHGIENVYIDADFTFSDKSHLYETLAFVPYKHLNLLRPEISTTVTEEEEEFVITLESNVFTPFVMLDVKDADVIFSDNVIDLTPGRPREIRAAKSDIRGYMPESAEFFKSRLIVECLQFSYMEGEEESEAVQVAEDDANMQ